VGDTDAARGGTCPLSNLALANQSNAQRLVIEFSATPLEWEAVIKQQQASDSHAAGGEPLLHAQFSVIGTLCVHAVKWTNYL
jgi:hypothetical protein